MASSTSESKVKDLVKEALKDALEKKRIASGGAVAPSVTMKTLLDKAGLSEVKKETPSVAPMVYDTLVSGQKWFSNVIGKTTVKAEFPVSCFHGYGWNEAVAQFVPDVDHTYYIDETLAKNILLAWELNEKVLCYGPTGTGKSSLIEQLCARTGRPYIRINCTGDMDSSMVFGQLTAKDGSTVWQDGPVTEAVKHGAVFVWDEWDVTPPEISMGLQWLLEDNGKLFLKDMPGKSSDKMIYPDKNFRLVALGNTQGQGDDTGAHAGTNVQNSATLDRFGTTVFIDYLPSNIEEDMLMGKCGKIVKRKVASDLVKLANMLRTAYKEGQLNLTLSPRSLFSMCNKVSKGVTLREAFQLVYTNKLNDTQRKVSDSLFTKVFGTSV